jgi:hypothetical protein
MPDTSLEPPQRNLLHRRASRRAVLAGGVSAVGFAGAYAALGDPLALFGSSGSDGGVNQAARSWAMSRSESSTCISCPLLRLRPVAPASASRGRSRAWRTRCPVPRRCPAARQIVLKLWSTSCSSPSASRVRRSASDRARLMIALRVWSISLCSFHSTTSFRRGARLSFFTVMFASPSGSFAAGPPGSSHTSL